MAKTQFRTRINAMPDSGEVQKNKEIMTVPDEGKSLREILSRFANGIPVSKTQGVYNPDYEYGDIDKMDVLDLHELKQHVANEVESKKQIADEIAQNLAKAKSDKAKLQAEKAKSGSEPKD